MESKALEYNEKKKMLAQYIWFNFFNSYLYTNKCITEEEYNKMISKISEKYRNTIKNKSSY